MPSTSFQLHPSKTDFLAQTAKGSVPPVFLEIPYVIPAELYASFQGAGSFLFESVKGPFNIARYSFIGFDPYAEYRLKDGTASLSIGGKHAGHEGHPLTVLKEMLSSYKQEPSSELPPFQGGAAGLFCYDFVHYLEKIPATTGDDLNIPDAHFLMIDKLIVFDHKELRAWSVCCPGVRNAGNIDWSAAYDEARDTVNGLSSIALNRKTDAPPALPGPRIDIVHDIDESRYCSMVERIKEYIAAGDIFQANISLRLHASVEGHSPWTLYNVLRDINPSPFAAFMDFGDYHIVSSSPERLVKVHNDIVETRPIAGTRPRGATHSEDNDMRRELLLNEKERAEHIMLIDLERNDIGRVCDYGSVHVDELMITEDYSHVIHIVSNVKGRLASGKTALDVVRGVFPGGTITGVPKVHCMEIIDELESFRRGPYTGSLGYIGFSGSMDMNIIIRTFTIKDGIAYVHAGAGIVADSDPVREYRESLRKAEALLKTLNRASA